MALDDDKIWVEQTGKNAMNKAGLNHTTHVRDNRKGIISHTAVSTGVNLPLGKLFYFKVALFEYCCLDGEKK